MILICHTARETIQILYETFLDRVLSRFGDQNRPPRSCDLQPLDFFLWGYLKWERERQEAHGQPRIEAGNATLQYHAISSRIYAEWEWTTVIKECICARKAVRVILWFNKKKLRSNFFNCLFLFNSNQILRKIWDTL